MFFRMHFIVLFTNDFLHEFVSSPSGVFSSVGLERYLDRVEVGGSNPSTPTKVAKFIWRLFSFLFLPQVKTELRLWATQLPHI